MTGEAKPSRRADDAEAADQYRLAQAQAMIDAFHAGDEAMAALLKPGALKRATGEVIQRQRREQAEP
jgi:hypothetical protein